MKRPLLPPTTLASIGIIASFSAAPAQTPPPDDAPFSAEDAIEETLNPAGGAEAAEDEDEEAFAPISGTWIAQGPGPSMDGQVENIVPDDEVVGAVHTVLAHPTDPDTIYAGTVNGGIWKTTNATAAAPSWTPLTDDQPTLSIGAMEFDPTDATANTIVVGFGRYSSFGRRGGSLSPGLIRTTDGGANWTVIDDPVLDGEACSGVHARGSLILFSGNEISGSGGLYRSVDGGVTWSTIDGGAGTGLPNDDVHDLEGDLTDLTRFYLALDEKGIYRSTDSGATWTDISDARIAALFAASTNNNNAELSVHPVTGRLYAAILNASQAEYIGYTDNPGAVTPVWTEMDIPCIPATGASSVAITGATNASPIEITTGVNHPFSTGNWVEISGVTGNTAANGVFRIDDTGATTFTLRFSSGNGAYAGGGNALLADGVNPRDKPGSQGRIHFSIRAHPTDPNAIFIGGDRQDSPFTNFIGASSFSGNLWRGDTSVARGMACPSPQWEHLTHSDSIGAIPGGGTASTSSPHADSREMVFDANGNIIEGDDGGIYRRTIPLTNAGDWFSIIGNLQCTEQHSIAYDTVSNIIFSGNQDTGTTFQTGIGSTTWDSVSTADGGDVAVSVDPSNASRSVRYSSFQNLGSFRKRTYNSSGGQVSSMSVSKTVIGGGDPIDVQFVTPIEINVIDANRLIIGADNGVYESFNQGSTVTQLGSANINSSNGGNYMVYGGRSGGVDNADLIYACAGSDVVARTAGTGAPVSVGGYTGGTTRGVIADPEDWRSVFVIDSNQVFHSLDAGATFTDITGNLGPMVLDLSLRSLEYVRAGAAGAIVVGTNQGVFAARDDDYTTWSKVGTGMPNVNVYDTVYDASDDVLVVGTLGRGAWKFDAASTIAGDATLYETWAFGFGLLNEDANPGLDGDGDGLRLGDEFVWNLDPMVAAQPIYDPGAPVGPDGPVGLPLVELFGSGATAKLRVTFPRRTVASLPGVTYLPQFSDFSLTSWVAGVPIGTTPVSAGWEEVIEEDTVDVGTSQLTVGRRYGRVEITVP